MEVRFVAGILDMLHAGHLELLRMMRKEAGEGKVIVILHDDYSCFKIKDKFPVQEYEHRKRNLLLTGLVNEVIKTWNTDPAYEFEKVIQRFPQAVYMRGNDLTDKFPGKWMLDKHNIPVVFKEYTKGVSSSKIRDSL